MVIVDGAGETAEDRRQRNAARVRHPSDAARHAIVVADFDALEYDVGHLKRAQTQRALGGLDTNTGNVRGAR